MSHIRILDGPLFTRDTRDTYPNGRQLLNYENPELELLNHTTPADLSWWGSDDMITDYRSRIRINTRIEFHQIVYFTFKRSYSGTIKINIVCQSRLV